jgi:hypothetical protein
MVLLLSLTVTALRHLMTAGSPPCGATLAWGRPPAPHPFRPAVQCGAATNAKTVPSFRRWAVLNCRPAVRLAWRGSWMIAGWSARSTRRGVDDSPVSIRVTVLTGVSGYVRLGGRAASAPRLVGAASRRDRRPRMVAGPRGRARRSARRDRPCLLRTLRAASRWSARSDRWSGDGCQETLQSDVARSLPCSFQ